MNNQFGGYIRSDGTRIYAGKKLGDIQHPGPKAEAQLWNYLIDKKKLNIATISNHNLMQSNYIQWLTNFTEEITPGTSFFNEPLGLIIPHIVRDEQAYILLKTIVFKRNASDTSSIKKITNKKSEIQHILNWLKTEFNTYDGIEISKDLDIKKAHEAYKVYAGTKRWHDPSREEFINAWNHYSHTQFTLHFDNILTHVNEERSKVTDLSSKKSKKSVSTSIVNKSPNTLLREAENDEELREQQQLEEATLNLATLIKHRKKLQKMFKQIEVLEQKESKGNILDKDQTTKKNKKDSINSELITVDKDITEIYSSFPQLDSKKSKSSSNSKSGSDTKSTSRSSGKTKKNPKSRTKKRKNTRKKSIK